MVLKYRARRRAVSTVTALRPRTISFTRWAGIFKSLPRRFWLIPRGFKKSSSKISPGCTGAGASSSSSPSPSMIIHYLHFPGVALLPDQADTKLVVDPDAVLPPGPPQGLQPISRRAAESSNDSAACSIRSLRSALRWMSWGIFFTGSPANSRSVSGTAKI